MDVLALGGTGFDVTGADVVIFDSFFFFNASVSAPSEMSESSTNSALRNGFVAGLDFGAVALDFLAGKEDVGFCAVIIFVPSNFQLCGQHACQLSMD